MRRVEYKESAPRTKSGPVLHALYNALWRVALPGVLVRMLWRSRRQPAYRAALGERLGRLRRAPAGDGLWVHAVSAGEANAAAPLVEAWLARHPQTPVMVTTTTPTGAERVRVQLGGRVSQAWMPLDLPGAVDRFLDAVRPRLVVLIESELWPNLIAACHRRSIPVAVVGARLSERSARRYQRGGALVRTMLGRLALIGCQTQADANRFGCLGAPHGALRVLGSLKLDPGMRSPAPLARTELGPGIGADSRIVVAGSTHPGEEASLLAAFAPHLRADGRLRLAVAPRHSQRAGAVVAVARGLNLTAITLSEAESGGSAQVIVVDRMGVLAALYGIAEIAFVGGSLVPHGGHNPLEAARQGVPVLCGPHMENFAEPCRRLRTVGALEQARDAAELVARACALFEDPESCTRRGRAGREAVVRGPATIAATLDALEAIDVVS